MVAIVADPATKPCAKSSVSAKMRILPDLPDPWISSVQKVQRSSTSAIRRAPPVPAANHGLDRAQMRMFRRPRGQSKPRWKSLRDKSLRKDDASSGAPLAPVFQLSDLRWCPPRLLIFYLFLPGNRDTPLPIARLLLPQIPHHK